jgi:AraC-like DNA-binding protein
MMEILSQHSYSQQLDAAIALNGKITFDQNGFDEEIWVRDRFGTIWDRLVELRPGLKLWLVQYGSNNELGIHKEIPDPFFMSRFRLSGTSLTLIPGLLKTIDTLEVAGHHYWSYTSDMAHIEQWFADHNYWDCMILVDLDIMRQYYLDVKGIPDNLRTLLEQENPPYFFQDMGVITPQMLVLLQQIWNTPFCTSLQRMYWEGCVLQLLSLQLNQWIRVEPGILQSNSLTPAEVDQIYQARDLLIQQQGESPSLLAVAQQVELSDRKLRKGFREIFGKTMFEYLHDYRMEKAKLLLCDRTISVATIANTIGYTHLGYFAAAFKKKFGVSPKQWQQGK